MSKTPFKTLVQCLEEVMNELSSEMGLEHGGTLQDIVNPSEKSIETATKIGNNIVNRLTNEEAFHSLCHNITSSFIKSMAIAALDTQGTTEQKRIIVDFLKNQDNDRSKFQSYEVMIAHSLDVWERANQLFESQLPKLAPPTDG